MTFLPATAARRPPALSVAAVDFAYANGQPVFHGLDLAAEPGEFVVLLGPSGCGKTTLLNLLSGFQQPQEGQVLINGARARPELPELGYVFQSPQLFPWLSALENVRFGLRLAAQLTVAAQRERALEYLRLVGLESVADRLPGQLSGGMQQRVALARALVLEPRVLLMDEPFAALDAISRASLNEETLRLWSSLGQTVLFITHDIDEAVFLADRVVLLDMAPRGIHSELRIDLPRPRRNLETRCLPAFFDYRNELTERIASVMAQASSLLAPSP